MLKEEKRKRWKREGKFSLICKFSNRQSIYFMQTLDSCSSGCSVARSYLAGRRESHSCMMRKGVLDAVRWGMRSRMLD